MKNGSKITGIVVALLVVTMAFTACGNTNSPSGEKAQVSQDNQNLETYEVTLDPNGGTFADGTSDKVTLEVTEGQSVDFTKYAAQLEGNDLRGWYYSDDTHKPWPGAKKVDSQVSLIAKWSQEEIQEVFELGMKIGDTDIPLTQDSDVYQFTYVSSIHGGYAQRSAKYTVHLKALKEAIEADDSSSAKVLYLADSSYVDATGSIYAEFYNDGTFELFYDYTYNGEETKYSMDYGVWTLEGYTPKVEAPAPLSEDQEGQTVHGDYDRSMLGDSDPSSVKDDTEAKDDIVTLPGKTFYEVQASNSDTMQLHFKTNNVVTIYMTTYETDVESKYLWSYDERKGLVISYNNDTDNKAVIGEDGDLVTVVGANQNTYEFSLSDFLTNMPDLQAFYIADASNTDTMKLFFYPDNAVRTMFDLTAYDKPGEFSPTAYGQWEVQEEGALRILIGGQEMTLEAAEEGVYQMTLDGNTYRITLSDLEAAAQ